MTRVRAAVLEAPERIVLRELDRPELGAEDALLKVELAGICGTDWKTFHGKLPYPLPLILGHEILGHISAAGDGFAKRHGLHVGDRVVVESHVPCWACLDCQMGNYRFCARQRGYGTTTPASQPPYLWGAFAEEMYLAPGTIVHRIREDIPAEAAILVTGVISNGVEWARIQGGVRQGDVVVVQGGGPQGLACALVARECGAERVIVTGLARDAARLDLARKLGAHQTVNVEQEDIHRIVREQTNGRMADIVIDVSGSPSAIATSVDLVRTQGTVVLGGLTGKDTRTPLDVDTLVWRGIRVQGVFTKGAQAIHDAVRLVESRRYPLEDIVTHRYSLDAASEAIRAIGGELSGLYPIKAAIEPILGAPSRVPA